MGLIRAFINIYILIIIIDVILSYLPEYAKTAWGKKIRVLSDYTCAHVRKYIPKDLPMDPTPLIVIVALKAMIALW